MRGTSRGVHRVGLSPPGLAFRGALDAGPDARAQHAGHVELCRVRFTARG